MILLRSWLNDRVVDSTWLRRIYGLIAGWRARRASARGQRFRSAELQLGAWRLLGPGLFGVRRMAAVTSLVREGYFEDGRPAPISQNRFLHEFRAGQEADQIRARWGRFPLYDQVRMRHEGIDDPERQGDLMVLKSSDERTGEKGVLFIMYTETIRDFPAVYDVARLAKSYMLVLEPSWWGYQDSAFLSYLGSDLNVVVLAQWRPDFEFIQQLQSNLVPLRLGAGDWIDPGIFRPKVGPGRTYDLVMISGWSPFKRHALLFRTLRTIRRKHGRKLTVALIGYPLHWPRQNIEGLMRRYDVQEQCTIFENISPGEVAQIVGDSKAYVLLSRREGANRGLYESLFAGTPVIVHRHHRGVNLDQITEEVGLLADDDELPAVILSAVDGWQRFRPAEWARANTGWANSSRMLNQALLTIAREQGLPWTRDIVCKKNAPNLRYAQAGVHREFEAEYERLKGYLLA